MENCVVAYGGSVVIPGDAYDERLMTELADILRAHEDKRFVLIIGGGHLCRTVTSLVRSTFINANLSSREIDVANDELGIAITKINARRVIESLKSYLGDDVVYGKYIDNPELIPKTDHRVFIASGFKPGVSTDFCMMRLAKSFNASKVFKISDFSAVLNVKPTEFNKLELDNYERIPKLTWAGILDLVGKEFFPGGHYPLDPPAAKLGVELAYSNSDLTLYVGEPDEFEKMLEGNDFIGTVIKNG